LSAYDDDNDDDWLYAGKERLVLPLLGLDLDKMGGFSITISRHIYVDQVTRTGTKGAI
jgi:hypothetical protein